MNYLLDQKEIENILQHWVNTPANSYRGSRYGEANNRTIFKKMSTDIADMIIQKIKTDIPLFSSLNSNALSIEIEDLDVDTKRVLICVGAIEIPIATIDSRNYQGDTFNVNAQ